MLEVRGLGVSLDGVTVLDGVDLHVAAGEAVAVLGQAGCGKTVLARALSGLVPLAAGRVAFLDQDLSSAVPTVTVQAGLIHVPQAGLVFPNLPVRDNLLLGATMRGRLQRQTRLAEVLEMVPHLRGILERAAGRLDRGTQQMVAIGRGLMAFPRLLVLDDAGGALTESARAELAGLIDSLCRQGMSVLVLGRAMVPPLTAASRVCVLEGGCILAQGGRTW